MLSLGVVPGTGITICAALANGTLASFSVRITAPLSLADTVRVIVLAAAFDRYSRGRPQLLSYSLTTGDSAVLPASSAAAAAAAAACVVPSAVPMSADPARVVVDAAPAGSVSVVTTGDSTQRCLVELAGGLTFLSALKLSALVQQLQSLPASQPVVIDGSRVRCVDVTGAELFMDSLRELIEHRSSAASAASAASASASAAVGGDGDAQADPALTLQLRGWGEQALKQLARYDSTALLPRIVVPAGQLQQPASA